MSLYKDSKACGHFSVTRYIILEKKRYRNYISYMNTLKLFRKEEKYISSKYIKLKIMYKIKSLV